MPSADHTPDTSLNNPFLILYPHYKNYPLPDLSTTFFMPPEHQPSTTPPSPSNSPSATSTPQHEPSTGPSKPATPLSPAQSSLLTLNTRPQTTATLPTPPSLPQKIIGICCVPYLNLRKRAKSTPGKGSHSLSTPPPASSGPSAPIRINSFERLTPTRISSYQSFPPPSFDHDGQPRALDSRLYPEEALTSTPSSANPAQANVHANGTSPSVFPNFSRPRRRESSTPGDQYTSPSSVPTTTNITPTSPPTSEPAASSSNHNNIPPIPVHLTDSLAERPDTTRKRCHYRRPSCRARIPAKSPKSLNPPH